MREMKESDNIESRFESIFNHVNEGILIANQRGQIVLTNPKLSELFGYDNEELMGQLVEKLIPDHLHSSHVGHRKAYMTKPSRRPMGKNKVLFGLKKNGEQFPVEISLSYYHLEEGLYVIAFIIDITERFDQQQKIARINEELKQLNENLERKVGERTLATVPRLARRC